MSENGGPLRLGILGSGKGSNFLAIADEIEKGAIRAEIALVISDVADSGILLRARERGFPTMYVPPGRFRTKMEPEAEARVVALLLEAGVEIVVLAGYLRMIKEPFLEAFPRRIINIHPSLLPAFPGLRAWEQALNSRAERTGCTVHYVDGGMDTGEAIASREVLIQHGDTPQTLHARIQEEERKLYPEVIRRLAEGKLKAAR